MKNFSGFTIGYITVPAILPMLIAVSCSPARKAIKAPIK